MRAGDVAGGADVPDEVAGAQPLADLDGHLALVAVPEHGAVIEADHGLVAEGAVGGRRGHDPGTDGADLGALGRREVQAGVRARPEAAGLSEAPGQVVAGDGQHPRRGLLLSRTPGTIAVRAPGSRGGRPGLRSRRRHAAGVRWARCRAAAAVGSRGHRGGQEQPGQGVRARVRRSVPCAEHGELVVVIPVRGHTGRGRAVALPTPGWFRCPARCLLQAARRTTDSHETLTCKPSASSC